MLICHKAALYYAFFPVFFHVLTVLFGKVVRTASFRLIFLSFAPKVAKSNSGGQDFAHQLAQTVLFFCCLIFIMFNGFFFCMVLHIRGFVRSFALLLLCCLSSYGLVFFVVCVCVLLCFVVSCTCVDCSTSLYSLYYNFVLALTSCFKR